MQIADINDSTNKQQIFAPVTTCCQYYKCTWSIRTCVYVYVFIYHRSSNWSRYDIPIYSFIFDSLNVQLIIVYLHKVTLLDKYEFPFSQVSHLAYRFVLSKPLYISPTMSRNAFSWYVRRMSIFFTENFSLMINTTKKRLLSLHLSELAKAVKVTVTYSDARLQTPPQDLLHLFKTFTKSVLLGIYLLYFFGETSRGLCCENMCTNCRLSRS